MSTGITVLNWNELLAYLKDMIQIKIEGDFNLDFSEIEELLNQYFPDIIELLKALVDNTKKPDGIQKMKGYHKQVISNQVYEFVLSTDEDIMLTGITYAQSIYKCNDRFDLVVINDIGEELKLFDSLYVKDAMQHKLFQVFFPVPKGYEVKLVMHNESAVVKDVWVDFEYLSVKGLNPVMGTVIAKYITEGLSDFVVLDEENLTLEFGVHTIHNTKNFEGYIRQEPTSKMITLREDEPTRIVEFFYKKDELDVGHAYDIKVILRWENDTSTDIDLYGFIDRDRSRCVSYRQKEYFETEKDKLWLDYDFMAHGPNGYEEQAEVLTILGFNTETLSIQLQNYNSRELTQDVLVEVSKVDGAILSTHSISKDLFNQGSTRNVHVCDVNIGSRKVLEDIKAIGSVGEF